MKLVALCIPLAALICGVMLYSQNEKTTESTMILPTWKKHVVAETPGNIVFSS